MDDVKDMYFLTLDFCPEKYFRENSISPDTYIYTF